MIFYVARNRVSQAYHLRSMRGARDLLLLFQLFCSLYFIYFILLFYFIFYYF